MMRVDQAFPWGDPKRILQYNLNAAQAKYVNPPNEADYPVCAAIVKRCLQPNAEKRASIEELLDIPEIAALADQVLTATQRAP